MAEIEILEILTEGLEHQDSQLVDLMQLLKSSMNSEIPESITMFIEQLQKDLNPTPKTGTTQTSSQQMWEAADILLNTAAVQQLSNRDYERLVEMMRDEKKSPTEWMQFLQSRDIEKTILEPQVRGKLLKGKKLNNLNTLLSQICKTRPVEDYSLYSQIQKAEGKFDSAFVGKNLSISFKTKPPQKIQDLYFNGSIKSCKRVGNSSKIQFEFLQEGSTYKTQLDLTGGFINGGQLHAFVSKDLGSVLMQRHKKAITPNQSLVNNLSLIPNPSNSNPKSTVLPPDEYQVTVGNRFNYYTGHFLHFRNRSGKTITFDVYDGGIDKEKEELKLSSASVKHSSWKTSSDLRDFLKYFKAQQVDEFFFEYKDSATANANIMVSEDGGSNEQQILQKLQEADKKKAAALQKLQAEKSMFIDILRSLIRGETLQPQDLSQKLPSLYNLLCDIVSILQESGLGRDAEIGGVLSELAAEANFSELVDKPELVSSVRILQLLSKAETHTQLMRNKDIVAFFGSTGSGKSTSVNYFIGQELEIKKNDFGDNVVTLVQNGTGSTAKIGGSIGTSETIYSEGLPFLQEARHPDDPVYPKLQNAVLCDNPGFHDTRGSDYEICTNMSIDRAMQAAKCIRAVVLVMPYETFTLDRANPVVSIAALIQERFPDIFTTHQDSFYILITKCSDEGQKGEAFKKRLAQHVREEQEQIKKMVEYDPTQIALDFLKERMKIFKSLQLMFASGHIHFISVEDAFDRDEILEQYLSSKGVPIQGYQMAMEGGDMREKFTGQMSMSANTWKLILSKNFEDLPADLENTHRAIDKVSKEIQTNQNRLNELEKVIIPELQKKLNEVVREIEVAQRDPTQVSLDKAAGNFVSDLKDLKHTLKTKEDQLNTTAYNLSREKSALSDLESEKKRLDSEDNDLEDRLRDLTDGKLVEKIIIEKKYTKGEKLFYCSFPESVRRAALNDVRALNDEELGGVKGFHIVGEEEWTFCNHDYISKDYALVPDSKSGEFDKEGYLTKERVKLNAKTKYEAKIIAKNVKLTDMKASNCGKQMVLQYETKFERNTFPSLEVIHYVPKEEVYHSEIANKQGRKNQIKIELSKNNDRKNSVHENINRYSREEAKLQADIENLKYNLETKEKSLKDKQQDVLKYLQQSMNTIKENLSSQRKELESKRDTKALLEGNIVEEKKKIDEISFMQQRFRFLIKDQLKKRVPQSLYEFTDRAFDLNKEDKDGNKKNKAYKDLAKEQNENFKQFKQIYEKYQKELKKF